MDVNMVVLLIISIGLAVDFSAHIGYTFMTVSGSRYGTLGVCVATILSVLHSKNIRRLALPTSEH